MADAWLKLPRIVLNDDASTFLYCWDDVGAEDLRPYLSRLQGTQVDMVAYCVAFGGYVTYYESEVAEPVGTGFAVTDRVKQLRWAIGHPRRNVANHSRRGFARVRLSRRAPWGQVTR